MGYTPTPYNETFSTAAALRSTSFGERPLRAPLAAPSLPPGAPHFFSLCHRIQHVFSSLFYLSVSRFVSLNGNRIWLFISRRRMHRNWGWFCSILTDKWIKLFFFIQRDGVFWWQRQGSRVWQPLRTREVNWVAEPYIERKCSVPTENATALGLTLPLCQMASIWMRRCGRICVAHPKPILFFV